MPAQDKTGPRGMGRFFNQPLTQSPADEKTELNEYEKALKQELQAVEKAKKALSTK